MTRRLLLLLFVLAVPLCAPGAAEDFARPGPHAVGLTQVSVPRADGTHFDAWLFYPALDGSAAAAPAAPDLSGAPYPGLVFGHGFLAPPRVYAGTLTQLASWGLVVIAPRSGLELFPDHDRFAADLSDALGWLAGAGQAPGSAWDAMVDGDALGAAGHSMGGGAAVLAAALDPRIRVLALLAPARTFPTSSVDQAALVRSPTLVLAGSEDAITPLARHALPIFQALGGPRQLAIVLGGSHCGFVSVPLPPLFCDQAAIPLAEQLDAASRSMLPFLLHELGRRPDLDDQVWGPGRIWQPPVLTIPVP